MQISPHENFPELYRGRVLLPESFVWFRLFQICTFGVLLWLRSSTAQQTDLFPAFRSIVIYILRL